PLFEVGLGDVLLVLRLAGDVHEPGVVVLGLLHRQEDVLGDRRRRRIGLLVDVVLGHRDDGVFIQGVEDLDRLARPLVGGGVGLLGLVGVGTGAANERDDGGEGDECAQTQA